jgi:predicted nucleic acid-binding protein
MSGDFIDSNVFVYTFDDAAPLKQQIARRITSDALASRRGHISHQVVQETLNVFTMKARFRMTPERAKRFLEDMLLPLWTVMPSGALYERGLEVQERYGYSFYDSLIIAAALEAGCDRILSEDLQHGQRIETLVIEDPFRQ